MAYAWSNIKLADRVIRAGSVVNKADLPEDGRDENWKALSKVGAIRNNPLPSGMRQSESARTAILRQAREAAEAAKQAFTATEEVTDTQGDVVEATDTAPEAPEAPETPEDTTTPTE